MILFADSNPSLGNNLYGNGTIESSLDLNITTYTLARGGLIKCRVNVLIVDSCSILNPFTRTVSQI